MTRRTALALVIFAFSGLGVADGAERVWQTGTWREVKVDRPRVSFGVQSRDPNSNLPRTSPAREIRTYVIDTDSLRLELRQDATADMPLIDAMVGEPVTFALEKKTVYVKDSQGKEHRLNVRKQSALPAAQTK
jgi:hypothetical protein